MLWIGQWSFLYINLKCQGLPEAHFVYIFLMQEQGSGFELRVYGGINHTQAGYFLALQKHQRSHCEIISVDRLEML